MIKSREYYSDVQTEDDDKNIFKCEHCNCEPEESNKINELTKNNINNKTILSEESAKTLSNFIDDCEISDDIMDRYQQDRCKTYLKALVYEAKTNKINIRKFNKINI